MLRASGDVRLTLCVTNVWTNQREKLQRNAYLCPHGEQHEVRASTVERLPSGKICKATKRAYQGDDRHYVGEHNHHENVAAGVGGGGLLRLHTRKLGDSDREIGDCSRVVLHTQIADCIELERGILCGCWSEGNET